MGRILQLNQKGMQVILYFYMPVFMCIFNFNNIKYLIRIRTSSSLVKMKMRWYMSFHGSLNCLFVFNYLLLVCKMLIQYLVCYATAD